MSIPPPAPADPPAPAARSGFGCGGCLLILLGIIASAVVLTLFSNFLGGIRDEDKVELTDMQQECARIVAEWAGIEQSATTSFNRTEGTAGWDFGGTYPGGEWQCGGPAGQIDPSMVIAFPGGVDNPETIPVTIVVR